MHGDAVGGSDFRDLLDRLDAAHLVIRPHDGDQGYRSRITLDLRPYSVQPHDALGIDGEPHSLGPFVPFQPFDGVLHRVMLDGGAKDPLAAAVFVVAGPIHPLTARLSASVPPDVKMSSEGCAPAAAAIASRASSTDRRARRPEACNDEGLPVRASSRVMAVRATAARGVVAAWSR
ncbi:hypothetical protein AHiyo8_54630 [Arthrobacter sp. Hiyo8]|nr:hypothetical protein AHiyo8_54630 [Arthrobacter sp. Hiyo8]